MSEANQKDAAMTLTAGKHINESDPDNRLILSSGARVAQMTYQTVIGVRHQLVSPSPTGCTFGRFVPPEDLRGGFLPVFGMYPPVRKLILVCATITVWAVIPAQVVTPLETTAPWASDTQLLALKWVTISFLIMQDC